MFKEEVMKVTRVAGWLFLLVFVFICSLGYGLSTPLAYGDSSEPAPSTFAVTPGEAQSARPTEQIPDANHPEMQVLEVPQISIPVTQPVTATRKLPTTQPQALANVQNTQTALPKRALILYDAPAGVPYQKLGMVYAIMLRNLLGHFEIPTDIVAIEDYEGDQVELYDVVFYMGSYFDNPIPLTFLNDVMKTAKTVVWFKYNIWQLASDPNLGFSQKFGLTFNGLRGLNDTPSLANPTPGFFDTVEYKGKELVKFYQFDEATLTVKADPEIGITQVVDAQKAQIRVVVRNDKALETAPYIIQSGNFWYVADLPLTFIGPRDRYLVMCDILHDIVGINHAEKHLAMVRLEDVGALVSLEAMKKLAKYLKEKDIPFSIAAIPFYKDPLGKYNGGIPMEIHLSKATNLLASLKYATRRGGEVIMHGYTHQYADQLNPWSGVSGDDFEFWNVDTNSPVVEDSVDWANNRIKDGLAEFKKNGYEPTVFEFPHYQGSPYSYQATKKSFKTRYERAFYYTSENPQLNLDVNDPARDFAAGQFFPYLIKGDYYGQTIIPENLGNIEYDISDVDPTSNVVYTWQDLLQNANYALVVRDGYASFFFHPFWLEPELQLPAFQDFKNLVKGIKALGYTWVGIKDAQ